MYILTDEKKIIEGRECTVYGVRFNDEFFVRDISADRAAAEKFAEKCNKYSLDPVHLRDAAEDFAAEQGREDPLFRAL